MFLTDLADQYLIQTVSNINKWNQVQEELSQVPGLVTNPPPQVTRPSSGS